MKVMRLYGPMDFRIDSVDEPSCGPGEVKVKTSCCGLCGSDKPRILFGEVPFFPSTIGHEFSGIVVETGKGVTTVEAGDLVTVVPLLVCNSCVHCRTGHYGQCVSKQFIGLRAENMGAFAQYNVLPERNVLKVPVGMDKVTAALVEPLSVAIHALIRIDFHPGHDIAIIGMGTIGQLLLQCARLLGAKRIFVFDSDDNQLDKARGQGANYCYNTTTEGFFEHYLGDTLGLGCLYTVEAVGLQATTMLAIKLCAVHGKVALVGYLDKPITFLSDEMRFLLENEINLFGIWQSYDLNFPGDAWRLGIHYLDSKKIDGMSLVSNIGTPGNLIDLVSDWSVPGKVTGKIMIDFDGF